MQVYEKLPINEKKKERIVYQSKMLHYGLYTPDPEKKFWADIPWHWHDEFEFGCIAGGNVLYKTNHSEFTLRKGDGIFINSGVLHYLHPLKPVSETALCTQFFDKTFLAGYAGSIYDIKYIAPVQELKSLDAVPLYQDNESDAAFLKKLHKCAEIGIRKEQFFEMRIRSLFSELWETIYSRALEKKESSDPYDPTEDERIKKMLSVIREHYSEKVTAADLARAVHISERECYRIFQNMLGITPGSFMLSIRLQKAQELLRYTDKSIVEIAVETGFGTGSYFCKTFKEYHHITPNQYRRMVVRA